MEPNAQSISFQKANKLTPVVFKKSPLTLTAWKRESKYGTFYTFQITRMYKNKNNVWVTTTYFRDIDIPKLQTLLNEFAIFSGD